MKSTHAQAVLSVCNALTASGHTVISANTDERGSPQIFAQSETGELAFYLVRPAGQAPTEEEIVRFRALAGHHGVAAYAASPGAEGEPPEIRAL